MHARLPGDLETAYGHLLVEKIRHKHTLARNHFSKLSTMAKYFAAEGTAQDTGEQTEDEEMANITEDISGFSLTGKKML